MLPRVREACNPCEGSDMIRVEKITCPEHWGHELHKQCTCCNNNAIKWIKFTQVVDNERQTSTSVALCYDCLNELIRNLSTK